MLIAAVKGITSCCISKAHIKQLLILLTSKTSQRQIPHIFASNTGYNEYGANRRIVNALLDSGSGTTLITSELAKTIKQEGKKQKLNITSALSKSVSVTSKLVEFSICSTHHPDQIEVKNAWVVDSLNRTSQCISKAEIQREWARLKDVPIDVIIKNIYILVGADLHIFIFVTSS